MKKITITIILALVLALSTMALAWGPGFGRGSGPGPGSGFPGYAIPNLTAEQSAQMQDCRDSFLKELGPLREELLAKREELQKLWSDPNADPSVIKAKQNEMFDLRSKFQEKATNMRLEMRKVLTPEQVAQLPTFGPGAGFGPRMGMGGPCGR